MSDTRWKAVEEMNNEIIIHGRTCCVLLPDGEVALADVEDIDLIRAYKWTNHEGYVVSSVAGKRVRMHRLVMGLTDTDDERIDHINGARFDNRKRNLRPATNSQNLANMSKKVVSTSGLRGVTRTTHGTWRAQITHNYYNYNLGQYRNLEWAARVYNAAARVLFGDFARLNTLSKDDEADREAHRTATAHIRRHQERRRSVGTN